MTKGQRVLSLSLAATLFFLAALPAAATVHLFICHDHPNGSEVSPAYGLRLDDLLSDGVYTFSFDYIDINGSASVLLEYDDVAGTIRIYGRVFGGKDVGSSWSSTEKGWANIDFTYSDHLVVQDNCAGGAGNDVYVTDESNNNGGTITLDGWGGDQSFQFFGKKKEGDCAFYFDNDYDSKGNGSISGDPSIWHGTGWLKPPTTGYRDWLFIAEMMTVPTEDATWGEVKSIFSE
jgi:hypothetical protein